MKVDTVEERVEVEVGLEGTSVDREVEGMSCILLPNLDALNTLVGTFADFHRMATA